MATKTRVFLLLLFGFAITILLYFPGLNGGYYFDDSHVLINNPFIKITSLDIDSLLLAANSFVAGGREFSMLSFALNHYFFGDSAWWLKFFNLVIHCVNGLGLFFLTSQFVNRIPISADGGRTDLIRFIPLIVTALWLVHPINLIPVLYISQRMALLSSFFIIFGLIFYVWARTFFTSNIRKSIYLPLGLACFTLFGYKCKENAILLPLFALIVEVTIFRFRDKNNRDKIVFWVFSLGAILIIAVICYKFWQHPGWISSGYNRRYYTLDERVLTQFRALGFYIYQILAPSNIHLSLWHDDFGLSTGLFSPVTTLISLLALSGIASVAVFTVYKLPLFSLGVFWFFVSHSIESTVFSLELVHEHRNYLASFGVILAVVSVLVQFLGQRKLVLYALVVGMFIAYSVVLQARAGIWSSDLSHSDYEARNRPDSAAAAYQLGQRYYNAFINGSGNAENLAFAMLKKAASNDPYNIAPELLLVILSEQSNIPYQDQWLASATEKIKKHPYMAPSKSAIKGFYQCMKDGKCRPPLEDVNKLFEAALESRDDNLLTTTAFYFTEINVDNLRAEKAFKKALRNKAPNWINYLSFLLHVNKTEDACLAYQQFKEKLGQNKFKKIVLHAHKLSYFERELGDC